MKTFAPPRARARVGEFLEAFGQALARELGTALDTTWNSDVGPVEDLTAGSIAAILPDPTTGWKLRLGRAEHALWCVLRRRESSAPDVATLADCARRAAGTALDEGGAGTTGASLDDVVELGGPQGHEALTANARFVARRVWVRAPDDVGVELLALLDASGADALARSWSARPSTFHDAVPVPASGTTVKGRVQRFVHDPSTAEIVERAAARAGLAIDRHGPADAPNPGAIQDGIVILDVPVGHERRIDWCARLKQRRSGIAVVMLLHHPSRARVLRGLVARPDVLLGLPVDDATLAERIRSLVSTPSRE